MFRKLITCIVLISFWASSAQAAILTVTGFETGSLVELDVSTAGTSSVVTTPVKTGTYAFRSNPTTTATGSAQIRSQVVTTDGTVGNFASADLWYEFQFRVATFPAANDEPFFICQAAGSVLKLEARVNTAGNILAYDSAASLLATGTTALSTNTWYRIGVRCGTGTSANWSIEINGSVEISGTGNLTTNNNAFGRLGKHTNRNGQTVDFFYDDLVVDSAAFVGNAEIKICLPTSNGSTMQWTAGTGSSDFTTVDELPPDDADYVASTTNLDVALFDVQDSSTVGISGTVKAVLGLTRQLANAVTPTSQVRIRSGSTNSDSTDFLHSGTTTTRLRLLTVDPDTSSAWTTGGIDGVEVGAEETTIAGSTTRITAAYIIVVYTPSAGGAVYPNSSMLSGVN